MMRLWVESHTKSTPVITSAMLSVAAHLVVIAACVYGTLPPANLAVKGIENRPYFIPPPDRVPGQRPTRESVRYVDLALQGPGSGDGPRLMGNARATTLDQTVGRANADTVSSERLPAIPVKPDSVFSVLEVDTAVVRSSISAAPTYPLKLLNAHITGFVNAQYVVDTTGFADSSSFTVMQATNPDFVVAVRQALPNMRFRPAKIGPLKVRQLVEQQFTFLITDTTSVASNKKKP